MSPNNRIINSWWRDDGVVELIKEWKAVKLNPSSALSCQNRISCTCALLRRKETRCTNAWLALRTKSTRKETPCCIRKTTAPDTTWKSTCRWLNSISFFVCRVLNEVIAQSCHSGQLDAFERACEEGSLRKRKRSDETNNQVSKKRSAHLEQLPVETILQ